MAVTPRVEGTSSIKFVQPPPPSPAKDRGVAVRAERNQEVYSADPILPLATPVYPVAALKAGAGEVIVGVRITVDADGRVSDVGTSLAALSTPSPFAAEFRAAVEVAVAQWRFRPGEVRHLETVHGPDGDYQRMTSRENVAGTFDVEFTFNATGVIAPAALK
jgi:outer membrane biosynthesis protein TonB